MNQTRSTLFMIIGIITCFLLQTQGADKYTDENRPYEFGFTIDGEQHRHETKDKNGIIQGEFGFITADGVYHVTVYATDEQGRFKILSMKNIRVKPYPSGATRQGHSLSLPSTANAVAPAKTLAPPPQVQSKPVSNEPPTKSCSHCSIPTTTPRAPPPAPPSYNNAGALGSTGISYQNQQGTLPSPNYQQNNAPNNIGGKLGFVPPSQINNINGPQAFPQQGVTSVQGSPQQYPEQQNDAQGQTSGFPQINPGQQFNPQVSSYDDQQNNLRQNGGINESPQFQTNGPSSSQAYPQHNAAGFPPQGETGSPQYPVPNAQFQPETSSSPGNPNKNAERTPKQFNPSQQPSFPGLEEAVKGQSPEGNQLPTREPKLIAAQMQIVDKNTDIYSKRPGEKDGLPEGLNKSDMEQLLYTFNYTVGFHGHFEEGYRNGAKQGYYFVTGRNGVRTRVDYVADSTGFHPKISQEVLDVSSDAVPKSETEKDAKYGLKGYEFKWLYYPVGS